MNDAQRIAAQPVLLEDINGEGIPLVFDMEAMMLVEEYFGTLTDLQEQLDKGEDGPIFTTIVKALAAGAKIEQPRELARRLNPEKTADYATALTNALAVAFPTSAQQIGVVVPLSESSPGETSTGQPQSNSVEATASSGA